MTNSNRLRDSVLAEIAKRNPRRVSAEETAFRCPFFERHANGDNKPSANFNNAKDVWTCRACGEGGGLRNLADALGINPDLGSNEQGWAIRNSDGVHIAEHVRYMKPDGNKGYLWKLPDGTFGLGGIKSSALPLYGSHSLPVLPKGSAVFVTEGEPAADALLVLGVTAVATVCGAAVIPDVSVLSVLAGFQVYLWPDCDEAGRTHMSRLAHALSSQVGVEPLMIRWPMAFEKEDAADFVSRGGSADGLNELLKAATVFEGEHASGGGDRSIPWHTGAEIAASTPERLDYLVPPYCVKGSLIELDGPIKRSGKTTLALNLAKGVLTGGVFLGRDVKSAVPVIYLTEEGRSSFQAALSRQGIASPDLHVLHKNDVRAISWTVIIRAARQKAREVGAGLLVVDTISGWCDFRVDAENDAAAALQAATPLLEATEDGLTVLFTRHDRKGSGVIGESGRGSSALGGTVDVLLHLQPANTEGHANRRTLESIGRYDNLPPHVVVDWNGFDYVVMGESVDVERREARTLLLEHLRPGREAALTEKDILSGEILKTLGRSTVKRALDELVNAGLVDRDKGFGKTKNAYGYWLAEEEAKPSGVHIGNDPEQLITYSSGNDNDAVNEVSSPRTPEQSITDNYRPNELFSPLSLLDSGLNRDSSGSQQNRADIVEREF